MSPTAAWGEPNSGILLLAGSLVLFLALSGCGTISDVKSASGSKKLDVSGYSKVLVQDFTDKASEKVPANKQAAKAAEMKGVDQRFADEIAREIERRGDFQKVSRTDTPDEGTLVVTGQITRYEEGSAAARFWVGMGAGSSYFDALVEFRQGTAGNLLGTMAVDKNSWVLGGGLASTQTPQTFITGAARKVADQLHTSKTVSEPSARASAKK
jgi:hypothetical protein